MTVEATVADYMTPSPHTIGAEQLADEALRRMRSWRIHHLPVLHGGELVGMLSERDAYFVVELTEEPRLFRVEDVMAAEPYSVAPTDRLADAALGMASRRIGSAVVLQDRKVVGVLTSTDALYALVDQLRAGVGEPGGGVEHREAQYKLARHARLRHLISTTDRAAAEVLADGDDGSALAALKRRLPRLLRVLAVEAAEPDRPPAVESELDALTVQKTRLEESAPELDSLAAEVHASLQRLRGGLQAQRSRQP